MKRLLGKLGANLRQIAGRERGFKGAGGAHQTASELGQGQRTPWAIRIFQISVPDPSPIHAAVLDFCWRRPVLRKLLLGTIDAAAKLSYYLRLLAELVSYPCRISMRHLRLLERELQLLPESRSALHVPERGDQLAEGGEQFGHAANVSPLRRASDEVRP